jgi:hypothetical protein
MVDASTIWLKGTGRARCAREADQVGALDLVEL